MQTLTSQTRTTAVKSDAKRAAIVPSSQKVIARAVLKSSRVGRLVELLETDRGPAVRIRGFSEDGDVAGDLMYPWHYVYAEDAERYYRIMVGSYKQTMKIIEDAN